jgi:hypothetical protein
MIVELLFWKGCPSHTKALAELRTAMSELKLDQADISLREILDQSDAEREHFVGSPTIRVEDVDIQPTENEPYGLSCRVYHRRDGRVSPTPDPSDVRDALAAAQAKHAANLPKPDPALDAGTLNK